MSQRLPDVVTEYERSRLLSQGMARNTVRNERRSLDHLLAVVGPIQVRHLTDRHIDQFLSAMQAKGHGAGTMNIHLQTLRNFFGFCVRRGYAKTNLVDGRRAFKQTPKRRLRVPVERFGELLDAASHPRDRILVAVGLFLWLRESEAINLKVGDVNLEDGEIDVAIHKTRERDAMPICAELDDELRRWLRYYRTDLGQGLEPDMYLIPAKHKPVGKDPTTGQYRPVYGAAHLQPRRRMVKSADIVKAVLQNAGYLTRDELTLEATREGMHTLRRSGARARFDFLVNHSSGYDGAMREVQAGLHHKSMKTTETYLGIEVDLHRRTKNIKGKRMYGYALVDHSADVVSLEAVREQASAGGHRV